MVLLRSWWARFAILAILSGVLLLPRMSQSRALLWSIGLAAVAATGIGMIRLSGRERSDMRLVEQSDRVVSPRDGERIAVCGVIEADGEPLQSPVRNNSSVLYHFSVFHLESSTTSEASDEVVDFAGFGATPARVTGPSFTARLGGFPTLYGFDEKFIDSPNARENAREYLRFATFEEMTKGTIEWIHIMDHMWDGRSEVVRDFRKGEARPIDQWKFNETSVAPGERVCVIGSWSAEKGALVAGGGLDLWLYRGTKDAVLEILSSSVGCGRLVGILMTAGSIATALFLAGVFG